MKKRAIALLLSMVLVGASLAGCGSKNEIHISEEAVPISSVVKASAAKAAPVIEEVTKEEEEAVFAEPNYCKDNNRPFYHLSCWQYLRFGNGFEHPVHRGVVRYHLLGNRES